MSATIRVHSSAFLIACLCALPACSREATPPGRQEANPLLAPPVDTAYVRSADEVATWEYHREESADLDGDGAPEQIVLAANVGVGPDGRPQWDDGQRWAVMVVSAAGQRTLLYARFVQLGVVEVAVLMPDDHGRRNVLVQERGPSQLSALEVEYHGPGEAVSSSAAFYQVERWLPGVPP